ncbi:class I SAM-dependent methyltransferase [Hwanghaeella grinnelliae]|uniref:Class I SAM-dependent methyltransferase n=1 Tax=Hwanghaeella grinnelliae TaxID=2500179 RepID=A0A437QTX0_9PROT|nr:class I SAM-dependent methyltransferase [Hwanghaeella grinnelliae]RVU37965.1 class I SAM-dependent methyltransferase [Hwanghaeella grinnelliae]
MIAAAKFWDKHADKYAQRPIKNVDAYERTLERTRAYLSKTDRVLEIGCGTGGTAVKLAGDAAHITGSDISPAMIGIARGRAEDQGRDNVSFVCGDACDLDFEDGTFQRGSFDAVMAFNLLHLLPDAEGAVSRAHALVKPGGYFISKTACLRDMSPLWRPLIFVMQAVGFAPFLRRFSKPELNGMIEAAGFEIVEGRSFPGAPESWFVVARKPIARKSIARQSDDTNSRTFI